MDRPDKPVRLLHFAWHHDLREDAVIRRYAWLELPIPRAKGVLITELCRLLAEKYAGRRSKLAYALRYGDGTFDPGNGEFLSQGGHGLTCATFVLAVFASYGVRLLRTEEWQPRPDDLQWQQEILAQLQLGLHDKDPGRSVDPRHIEDVEREIGCARFRPGEVAAAGAVQKLPLGFEDAKGIAEAIVHALRTGRAR
ncbi:MAG TPA: hypothetical protein VLS89_10180 [Candidatus Nanopelagicales bacterium]|nr:hypothetical protein [Candidatus Nanopelagicales bacterium]